MSDTRIERDSMGELQVPAQALYGAQTQRAVDNFPISGQRMPAQMARAMKRWMFSSTWRGWSEVRARIRSSGSRCFRSSSAASTLIPKASICSPARIWMESVTARVER